VLWEAFIGFLRGLSGGFEVLWDAFRGFLRLGTWVEKS
jgi:hypothetical protein